MLERLERQKTLTANQWKIIATANVGDMLDFFDFFLIGYVLVTSQKPVARAIYGGMIALKRRRQQARQGRRAGRRSAFK
jgi:hypothetical protein